MTNESRRADIAEKGRAVFRAMEDQRREWNNPAARLDDIEKFAKGILAEEGAPVEIKERGFTGYEKTPLSKVALRILVQIDKCRHALDTGDQHLAMMSGLNLAHLMYDYGKIIKRREKQNAAKGNIDDGKTRQMNAALDEVETMMKNRVHLEWPHHYFIQWVRRQPKYNLLAESPTGKQPPRDKLREEIIKLCKKYGYKVSGRCTASK